HSRSVSAYGSAGVGSARAAALPLGAAPSAGEGMSWRGTIGRTRARTTPSAIEGPRSFVPSILAALNGRPTRPLAPAQKPEPTIWCKATGGFAPHRASPPAGIAATVITSPRRPGGG